MSNIIMVQLINHCHTPLQNEWLPLDSQLLSATWAIMKSTVYWLVCTEQSSVSTEHDRSLLSMSVKPVT